MCEKCSNFCCCEPVQPTSNAGRMATWNAEKLDNLFDDVICVEDVKINCCVTVEDINCLNQLKVPTPHGEHDRIRILREAKLFDTPPEEDYERFTSLVSRAQKVSSNIFIFITPLLIQFACFITNN